jgi:hypothetical protein
MVTRLLSDIVPALGEGLLTPPVRRPKVSPIFFLLTIRASSFDPISDFALRIWDLQKCPNVAG